MQPNKETLEFDLVITKNNIQSYFKIRHHSQRIKDAIKHDIRLARKLQTKLESHETNNNHN